MLFGVDISFVHVRTHTHTQTAAHAIWNIWAQRLCRQLSPSQLVYVTKCKPRWRGRVNALKDPCVCVNVCVAVWGSGFLSACVCMSACVHVGVRDCALPCPFDTAKFTLWRGSNTRGNICWCQDGCYQCKTFKFRRGIWECCVRRCKLRPTKGWAESLCVDLVGFYLVLHALCSVSVSVCRVLWYAGKDAGMIAHIFRQLMPFFTVLVPSISSPALTYSMLQ